MTSDRPAAREMTCQSTAIVPFSEDHLSEAYLSWLRDPKINRYLVGVSDATTGDDVREFCTGMMQSADDYFFAIVDQPSLRHIGNVRLGKISWPKRSSGFGIMIGDRSFQGLGHAGRALDLVESFCFGTLKLETLKFPVVEGHKNALHLYRNRGYVETPDWPERFKKGGMDLPMVGFAKASAAWRNQCAGDVLPVAPD